MYDLSIIIPSYNTKKITQQCINLLLENLQKTYLNYQIIVVDNHSSDGSVAMLKDYKKKGIDLIVNPNNKGYAKANNLGLTLAKGQYVLFLNSDVYLKKDFSFNEVLSYIRKNPKVGGLTVKVLLSSGNLDLACHRGFPTIWRSFCYFTKLELIFSFVPLFNRLFCGYHLLNRLSNTPHEIDSPSGAFYLISKKVLDIIGGFDEDYFMYGEDIDLSYRIKKIGYSIIYFPYFTVLHLKYQSGIKRKRNEDFQNRIKSSFYTSMGIFYKKHYINKYPKLLSNLILSIITQFQKKYEKNRD